MKQYNLINEQATVHFGNQLADALKAVSQKPVVIHLMGDLGAGKTTLSRGIIQGLGFSGNVKSPTYTLVEPYESDLVTVYHFDLYRLADPEELEFMGIRDYFTDTSILLIEWPEKAGDLLTKADVFINLEYEAEQRLIKLNSQTQLGEQILNNLK